LSIFTHQKVAAGSGIARKPDFLPVFEVLTLFSAHRISRERFRTLRETLGFRGKGSGFHGNDLGFRGRGAGYCGSHPAFRGKSRDFAGTTQDFTGGIRDFAGGVQDFAGTTGDFMGMNFRVSSVFNPWLN
jgi:hypothetical protein